MFIDIHTHAYRLKTMTSMHTPDQLLKRMDELKIDMAVLLPFVNAEIYFTQQVEDIVEMAQQNPDRFIPYCNVDPRCRKNSSRAPLADVLRYYKSLGCKGVGEVMPNMEIMDPMVQNLFAAAEEVGLPLVYDGSPVKFGNFGLYDDPGLPQLEYSLLTFPDLKLFGHGPVFWHELGKLDTVASRGYMFSWKGRQVGYEPTGPIEEEGVVPKLFRKYPNLLGDLSDGTAYAALARDDKYGPRFLTEFQDRLFFGTDMITPTTPVELDKLLISWKEQGKISQTVFQKIAHDNAAKLLDIH